MHAVVINVKINDSEAATTQLRGEVVPEVKQIPGFVAGYWARKNDSGMSMIILESEDAANAMAERAPTMVAEAVTFEHVEVREVVAHA